MYICIETVLEGCAYTPVDNSHQLPFASNLRQGNFHARASIHPPNAPN